MKTSPKLQKNAVLCVFLAIIFATLCLFCACDKQNESTVPTLSNVSVREDAKFHAAVVDISIDDFNALGFTLGDSCDITFSNGYTLEDVPYFNGYYVKNGAPVIVAYPSNTNVLITLNNVGIWSSAALSDGCTVSIKLNAAKKYSATQEALGQSYSLSRDNYSSDEEFSNFRALCGGNLKENFIFRGASPVDNSRNRAPYTDNLLKSNAVTCIIDLADSETDMQSYLADEDFNSNYTKSVYESDKMILLSMGSGYTTQAYKESVVKGFEFMLAKDEDNAKYYVHCMEGKDRTGFVCALIEALAGASYDEMRDDYMTTYQNYYKISKESTPQKYDAVVALYFDSFMECLHGTSDLATIKTADHVSAAKQYLLDGGMSADSVTAFITLISK